jgi:zinc transport system ATP-binding protein
MLVPDTVSPLVPGAEDGRDASADWLARTRDLGVLRGGRWLVRNVDLVVRRGEIVTLVGPNGSGKSTCVKAILGLLRADEGTAATAPGLRIGYVPQQLMIDRTMPMTVRRLMTLTGHHTDAQVMQALEAVGIARYAASPVQQLSGGEFQRALLARAIIREPDLLVLDEPVQGVDFSGEIELYELIRDIRARLGCGILLISHDLHIVMAQTDIVVCLNGHVCCSGTPRTVAESPEYARLFGPRAAQTLAVYRHEHDHVHDPDGAIVPLQDGEDGHDHAHGHGQGSTGDAR